MNEERSRSLKAIGKVVLKIFLVCLVITAVVYAALAVMAQKKEKTALAEWKKAGYSLDNKYNSLKAAKENDSAKELRDLAVKIGITTSENPVSTKADFKSAYDYMTDQLQKEKRDLTRPSKEIEDTIVAARPGIDELCSLLDKGTAEIILAKQRNGPTGDVKLTWRQEFTRFEDRSEESYDEFESFAGDEPSRAEF